MTALPFILFALYVASAVWLLTTVRNGSSWRAFHLASAAFLASGIGLLVAAALTGDLS
jgi:hypothetical protein